MKIEIIKDPLSLLERANSSQRKLNASRLSQAVHREKDNKKKTPYRYQGGEDSEQVEEEAVPSKPPVAIENEGGLNIVV